MTVFKDIKKGGNHEYIRGNENHGTEWSIGGCSNHRSWTIAQKIVNEIENNTAY